VKLPEPLLIVGTGNLAAQLLPKLLAEKQHDVYVSGSTPEKTISFVKLYGGSVFNPNTTVTLKYTVILCVPDSEIKSAASCFVEFASCILHCSGSTDIGVLLEYTASAGVIWPVQSFTVGRTVFWSDVPLCIESTDKISKKCVFKITELLGGQVCELSSVQRQKLHLAAVVVNNFTNQLAVLTESFCQQNKLEFKLLLPLLIETTLKLEKVAPKQAQTGPARRSDQNTLQKHLNLLEDNASLRAVYKLMSEQIDKQYH